MVLSFLVMLAVVVRANAGKYYSICSPPDGMSTHAFTSRDIFDEHDVSLGALTKGKVTMIVNTATFSGYTYQYHQMNPILDYLPPTKYSIVGFPCNQFGHQEPGANATEILNGLYYVRPGNNFKVHDRLQMMLKGDLNGHAENPLYTFLKTSCPQPSTAVFEPRENFWDPIQVNDITWNFEKFIISPRGVPLYRFRPMVEPFHLVNVMVAVMELSEDAYQRAGKLEMYLDDLDKMITYIEKTKNNSEVLFL